VPKGSQRRKSDSKAGDALSVIVAGHYSLDVYILNLSSVNNNSLATLLHDLSPRYVVLIEDINIISTI
jgi:hypothetical protein